MKPPRRETTKLSWYEEPPIQSRGVDTADVRLSAQSGTCKNSREQREGRMHRYREKFPTIEQNLLSRPQSNRRRTPTPHFKNWKNWLRGQVREIPFTSP